MILQIHFAYIFCNYAQMAYYYYYKQYTLQFDSYFIIMKKYQPRSSIKTTHSSKISSIINGQIYLSFCKQQDFVLQISQNVSLVMVVSQNFKTLHFNGQICNKNLQPLKVSSYYWKTISTNQNLQTRCTLFYHSWEKQTIKCALKVALTNQSQNVLNKIFVKKLQTITCQSQKFVLGLKKLGISNFYSSNSFSQRKKCIKAKRNIKELLQEKLGDNFLQQAVIKKLSDLSIDQKNYGDIIENCQIKKILPKQLKKQQLQALQYLANFGQYNIKKNLNLKITSGGYFDIQYNLVRIAKPKQYGGMKFSDIQTKGLISKRLKNERINQSNRKKLQKQLQIVRQIKNKKHIINYYKNKDNKNINMQQNQNQIYAQGEKQFVYQTFMDFHPHTVRNFLDKNQFISYQDVTLLSKQILSAIQDIHDSQVVHRDIKPSNFLIDFKSNPTKFNVKIIDFCQSAIHSQKNTQINLQLLQTAKNVSDSIFQNFDRGLYGYTLPYSPIQCAIKNDSKYSQGINNYKIDSWSIGIVLYQMMFKAIPINQSQPYKNDIAALSNKDFEFNSNYFNHHGVELLKSITKLLVTKNLRVKQKERMSVNKIKQIYQFGSQFTSKLISRAWTD